MPSQQLALGLVRCEARSFLKGPQCPSLETHQYESEGKRYWLCLNHIREDMDRKGIEAVVCKNGVLVPFDQKMSLS